MPGARPGVPYLEEPLQGGYSEEVVGSAMWTAVELGWPWREQSSGVVIGD